MPPAAPAGKGFTGKNEPLLEFGIGQNANLSM